MERDYGDFGRFSDSVIISATCSGVLSSNSNNKAKTGTEVNSLNVFWDYQFFCAQCLFFITCALVNNSKQGFPRFPMFRNFQESFE